MKVILKCRTQWINTEVELDITDWYERAGEESIEDFEQKHYEEIEIEAVNIQGLEWELEVIKDEN